jgi:hypothetical protein
MNLLTIGVLDYVLVTTYRFQYGHIPPQDLDRRGLHYYRVESANGKNGRNGEAGKRF